MKSVRIYQPFIASPDESIRLDKAASNHLLRVLRLKSGHHIQLFNGDGFNYDATLKIDGKSAIATNINRCANPVESTLYIHLYQGISKGDRMDFAIQKSTELGVHEITPVFCERTVVNLKGERLDKKVQHWQAIAISACEQSGRSRIPRINTPARLPDIISHHLSDDNKDVLQLVLDPLSSNTLSSINFNGKQVNILIGPEGGLADSEVEFLLNHSFTGTQLGPRILRTETAALSAITGVQLLWGDLASQTNES